MVWRWIAWLSFLDLSSVEWRQWEQRPHPPDWDVGGEG